MFTYNFFSEFVLKNEITKRKWQKRQNKMRSGDIVKKNKAMEEFFEEVGNFKISRFFSAETHNKYYTLLVIAYVIAQISDISMRII